MPRPRKNTEMTPQIVRVIEFCDSKKMSPRQLSLVIDIPYGTLSNWVSGRRKSVDSQLFFAMAETFPDLSMEWLIRGKGEMLLSAEKAKEESPKLADVKIPTRDDLLKQALEQNMLLMRELLKSDEN